MNLKLNRDIAERTVHAQLKYMILESAMMIQDGYTDQDVINRLMEVVELIDSTDPKHRR
jgi:hypothetical protein